jgi:hypothetical protein
MEEKKEKRVRGRSVHTTPTYGRHTVEKRKRGVEGGREREREGEKVCVCVCVCVCVNGRKSENDTGDTVL